MSPTARTLLLILGAVAVIVGGVWIGQGLNLIPNSPLVRETYGLDDTVHADRLARPIVDDAIPFDAVWDCVTCGACVEACPVVVPGGEITKAINLGPREPLVATARENIAFFETLPMNDRARVDEKVIAGLVEAQGFGGIDQGRRQFELVERRVSPQGKAVAAQQPGRGRRQHRQPQ